MTFFLELPPLTIKKTYISQPTIVRLFLFTFVRALTIHIFGEITYRIIFSHTSDLLIIICSGQGLQSVWIKFTTSRIKLLPVILGQFGSEGINGDDKCPPICLKGQNLAHDFLKMPNILINVDNKCPSICLKGQNLAHDFLKMPNMYMNYLMEMLNQGPLICLY